MSKLNIGIIGNMTEGSSNLNLYEEFTKIDSISIKYLDYIKASSVHLGNLHDKIIEFINGIDYCIVCKGHWLNSGILSEIKEKCKVVYYFMDSLDVFNSSGKFNQHAMESDICIFTDETMNSITGDNIYHYSSTPAQSVKMKQTTKMIKTESSGVSENKTIYYDGDDESEYNTIRHILFVNGYTINKLNNNLCDDCIIISTKEHNWNNSKFDGIQLITNYSTDGKYAQFSTFKQLLDILNTGNIKDSFEKENGQIYNDEVYSISEFLYNILIK